MKRYFFLAAMIAAGALLQACDWTFQIYQPTSPSVFVVNQNTDKMEIGPEALEHVVYISSDMEWYAAMLEGTWCTLLEQSFFNEFTSSLRFKVQANNSLESRTDSLIVLSGNETRKIAIIQSGIGSLLGTDEINLHGTVPIQYKLNATGSWTLEKDGDWFSVSPDKAATGQVITFAANDENLDVQGRAGSVTFKLDGGLALTVPVKQGITETILVQSTSVELESMAGDFIVKTLTNVDYSVHSDVSWIHTLGTKALLEFEEQFSAEENLGSTPRTGHITFIYNNISETVTVTQAGRDPVLDVTAPGFYGIQGKDYVYRKGLCQYTRYNYGEYRAYRLIIPSEVCVVQVQGLPVQPSAGDTIQLAVSVHQNGQTVYSQPANMKVLGNDDSFIWLKSTTNGSTYFVIKKLR